MKWTYDKEPPKTKEERDSMVMDIVSSVALEFGIIMEQDDFHLGTLYSDPWIDFTKVPEDIKWEFAARLEEALGGIDDIVFEEDIQN